MANSKGLSRRLMALLWLLGAAFLIGILVYLEQIALLYAVATVALVVLLLIVAFADLENVGRDGSGFGSQAE
jgi:membrane protein implicated in regulation of membrane protease activity